MTTSFRASLKETLPQLREELRRERDTLLAGVPADAVEWLALTPAWTLPLAAACGFPTGADGTEETLKRLREAGFAVSGRSTDKDAALQYWMPDGLRQECQAEIIGRADKGRLYLQNMIARIGNDVAESESRQPGLAPAAVARWARLAKAAGDEGALATEVGRALDETLPATGVTSENHLAEANHWLAASQRLEPIFGGVVTQAVAAAARRIELASRRLDDERRLVDFLVRPAQVEAFRALLEPGQAAWALHYVGFGGVGKTMLARHLTVTLAPAQGAAVARIDFDHLNPDYPTRAPWMLLELLAEQLRLHDTDGYASKVFTSFENSVKAERERLAALPPGSHAGDPAWQSSGTFVLFVDAVRELRRPIVIILDTCEELAKIRPDGELPSNVRATFALLESVHQRVDTLRVVFCGRRPLASSGAGWRLKDAPPALPGRPYLRLHEIRGFLPDEARAYLSNLASDEVYRARLEDGELVGAILERCRDAGHSDRFEWTRPADAPDPGQRHNPFELALYASWIREDPQLTPALVRDTHSDQYVKVRILGRIQDQAVRDLLPAAALLRRFDRQMLKAAWPGEDGPFQEAFAELSRQEWTAVQGQFLQVEPALVPRLMAHYERSGPQLARTHAALLAWLEEATVTHDLGDLDVTHFEAAVRLIGHDTDRSLAWWRRVEERTAAQDRYAWIRQACERLLADDGALPPGASARPLRAAVLATYAATLTHTGVDAPATLWSEVLERTAPPGGPGLGGPWWADLQLRYRAVAGRAAASTEAGEGMDALALWGLLARLVARPDEMTLQVAASCVAALDALVEQAEREGHSLPIDPQLLVAFSDLLRLKARPDVAAFGMAGCARALLLGGPDPRADVLFALARKYVGSGPIPRDASDLLDWVPPPDVVPRVWLEFCRALQPATPPEEILEAVEPVVTWEWRPQTVDQDRLSSAVLLLKRALRADPVPTSFEPASAAAAEPVCNAHLDFPPLSVAWAEARATNGEVDAALALLVRGTREFEQTARVTAVISAVSADFARTRIARRMRLFDAVPREEAPAAMSLERAQLRWALLGLSSARTPAFARDAPPRPAGPPLTSAEEWAAIWSHARWRAISIFDRAGAAAAFEWWAAEVPAAPPSSYGALSCSLDTVEAELLRRRWDGDGSKDSAVGKPALATVRAWEPARPQPVERLTLLLRAAVLAGQSPKKVVPRGLVEQVGRRRAATIALDEGELLALRLPEPARALLELAHDLFDDAHDPVGDLIACAAAAMVETRLGDAPHVWDGYDDLLKRSSLPLPSRIEIRRIGREVSGDTLDEMGPQGWLPWLRRLAACAAVEYDREDDGDRLQRILAWHSREGSVPSELAVLQADVAHRRRPRSLKSPAVLSVPSSESVPLPNISPPAPEPVTSPADDPVRVSVSGRAPFFQVQVATQRALSHEAPSVKVSGRFATRHEWRVEVDPVRPYREGARLFPDSGTGPLAEALGSGQPFVEIALEPAAAAPCWEALLVRVTERALPNAGSIEFQRVVPAKAPLRRDVGGRVTALFLGTGSLAQQVLVRDAWTPLIESGLVGVTAHSGRDVDKAIEGLGRDADLVHLVVETVETGRGIRMQFTAEVELEGPAGRSRTQLMAAHDVPEMFPRMRVCVVQGVPTPEARRSSSEREQAAHLRAGAAELSAAGVQAVVMLPPMARAWARQAVSLVAFNLRAAMAHPAPADAGWTAAPLRRAVAAFRRYVIDHDLSDDAFEAAMDACLYVRP